MTPLEKTGEVLVSYTRVERRRLRRMAGPSGQSARYQRRAIKAFNRFNGERQRAEAAAEQEAA